MRDVGAMAVEGAMEGGGRKEEGGLLVRESRMPSRMAVLSFPDVRGMRLGWWTWLVSGV